MTALEPQNAVRDAGRDVDQAIGRSARFTPAYRRTLLIQATLTLAVAGLCGILFGAHIPAILALIAAPGWLHRIWPRPWRKQLRVLGFRQAAKNAWVDQDGRAVELRSDGLSLRMPTAETQTTGSMRPQGPTAPQELSLYAQCYAPTPPDPDLLQLATRLDFSEGSASAFGLEPTTFAPALYLESLSRITQRLSLEAEAKRDGLLENLRLGGRGRWAAQWGALLALLDAPEPGPTHALRHLSHRGLATPLLDEGAADRLYQAVVERVAASPERLRMIYEASRAPDALRARAIAAAAKPKNGEALAHFVERVMADTEVPKNARIGALAMLSDRLLGDRVIGHLARVLNGSRARGRMKESQLIRFLIAPDLNLRIVAARALGREGTVKSIDHLRYCADVSAGFSVATACRAAVREIERRAAVGGGRGALSIIDVSRGRLSDAKAPGEPGGVSVADQPR